MAIKSDLIVGAVVLGGVYWLLKKPFGDAKDSFFAATEAIGSKIGERVFAWTHPTPPNSMITYGVIFPDGTVGAVNSEDISARGEFTYWRDGSKWRIAGTDSGKMIAIPAGLKPGELLP